MPEGTPGTHPNPSPVARVFRFPGTWPCGTARRGEAPWRFAARGGEEYELLAAMPADVCDDDLAGAPVPLTVIGLIEADGGLRAFERGAAVTLPAGHDHFR